jgi:hypothetical protein
MYDFVVIRLKLKIYELKLISRMNYNNFVYESEIYQDMIKQIISFTNYRWIILDRLQIMPFYNLYN